MKTSRSSNPGIWPARDQLRVVWELKPLFPKSNENPGELNGKHIPCIPPTGEKSSPNSFLKIFMPTQQCLVPLIMPPTTQAWLVIICIVLLLAILAYLSFWLYRSNIERKQQDAVRRKLKEANEFKSRVLDGVTQDFRASLVQSLEIAEQSIDNSEELCKEELLARIQRLRKIGQRMFQLADQALDLRKLELGQMGVKLESGDIVHFLQQITSSFEPLATKKSIQLSFLTEIGSLIMDYDQDKICKILSNLLSNAFHATPEHGRVCVCLRQKHGQLYIKVKDTGEGIPNNQLPLIFDRIQMNHSVGNGIVANNGLLLVKELAKLLGGETTVRSMTNVGTVFCVRLQVQRGNGAIPLRQLDNQFGLHPAPVLEERVKEAGPHNGNKIYPYFDMQIENVFYQKVLNIIDKHLDDTNFNVEVLCRELNISYSQLQRKISRVTDKSPNNIIRESRLQKALSLLHDPNINIGEIAFQTGFADPSYFTRIFTREFGMPPSEYRDKSYSTLSGVSFLSKPSK